MFSKKRTCFSLFNFQLWWCRFCDVMAKWTFLFRELKYRLLFQELKSQYFSGIYVINDLRGPHEYPLSHDNHNCLFFIIFNRFWTDLFYKSIIFLHKTGLNVVRIYSCFFLTNFIYLFCRYLLKIVIYQL